MAAPTKPGGKAGLGAVRRQWDEKVFEQRAKDRAERELEEERQEKLAKAPPRVVLQRAPLDREKARGEEVDVHGAVGMKKVVNTTERGHGATPFYCSVCESELHDSAAWFAHLNSKRHVRNMGMNMRAERSTVEGVKAKLASMGQVNAAQTSLVDAAAAFREQFDARLREKEEEERRALKAQRAAEKECAAEAEEDDAVDPEMAAMGFDFGSFGGGKKK